MSEKPATLVREVGNWVTEDRFWNRKHELQTLTDLLGEGANILLVAPRRVGKTSLMRELARRLRGQYNCLHIDLQKSMSPVDAMVELSTATRPYQNLWLRTLEVFKNTLGRVDSIGSDDFSIKIRDGLTADWQAKGDRLLDAIASAETDTIIFIDELPILVNRLLKGPDNRITPERIQQTDVFVSWLRAVSIRHRGKLRFVLAGSIGLEPLLRQAGLSATVNNFTAFELPAWAPETAIGCLRALANQYQLKLEPGVPERVVSLLGSCIPHHVQMFFSHIYEDRRRHGQNVCKLADVEQVYEHRMLSTRGHAELSHLEERLKQVLGDEVLPLALDLLTETAVVGVLEFSSAQRLASEHLADNAASAPPSTSQQSNLDRRLHGILEILEHDGYIGRRDGRYEFISHLLRDWWRARFAFGYVAVANRE